jgi:ArsR family transcriptional regulator
MPATLSSLVTTLKATADPSRLRLLAACVGGEFTVSELTRILGQSQPRVSRHLRTLCDAGLVLRFRERHFVYYRVPARGPQRRLIRALLAALDGHDAALAQDRVAMDAICGERDQRAREVMAATAKGAEPFADPDVCDGICQHADLEDIGDLLDIGTGTGRVLKLLAPYARSAVGIDISSDMLTVARSNLSAAGLGSVMIRHGDMYRLPYPDATFDTVTVDGVLSHALTPSSALAEAARILRPGGALLVIESCAERGDTASVDEDSLREWTAGTNLAFERRQRVGSGQRQVDLFFAKNDNNDAAVAEAARLQGRAQ